MNHRDERFDKLKLKAIAQQKAPEEVTRSIVSDVKRVKCFSGLLGCDSMPSQIFVEMVFNKLRSNMYELFFLVFTYQNMQ